MVTQDVLDPFLKAVRKAIIGIASGLKYFRDSRILYIGIFFNKMV
jgi:hypothetical protein